jgi:hypothetical protein
MQNFDRAKLRYVIILLFSLADQTLQFATCVLQTANLLTVFDLQPTSIIGVPITQQIEYSVSYNVIEDRFKSIIVKNTRNQGVSVGVSRKNPYKSVV